jgi:hypothetical protein
MTERLTLADVDGASPEALSREFDTLLVEARFLGLDTAGVQDWRNWWRTDQRKNWIVTSLMERKNKAEKLGRWPSWPNA